MHTFMEARLSFIFCLSLHWRDVGRVGERGMGNLPQRNVDIIM